MTKATGCIGSKNSEQCLIYNPCIFCDILNIPLSAQDSLLQASTSIKAAQTAQVSKHAVIKHYWTAKNALAEVDVMKTDPTALKEMIAAFQELAVVLDHSEAELQGKAAKCRQRADALRWVTLLVYCLR